MQAPPITINLPSRSAEIRENLIVVSYGVILILLLALMAIFSRQMWKGETISVDRKWGALGKGADGWSCTPPVATLTGVVSLLFIFAALLYEATNL